MSAMIGAPRLEDEALLDAVVEPILRAARIPGAAVAVVAGGQVVCARGYGVRDLQSQLPIAAETIYPIGSTTKSMNATLLAMLVDAGKLAWDVPVQAYLPAFRLLDPLASAQVTLRDLLTMRTGLPRHDWLWIENLQTRAELTERLRFLEPAAKLRERFQYNNLTVTAAAHVAETVAGCSWEELMHSRLFEPLGMRATRFGRPDSGNVTSSYLENERRQLLASPYFSTQAAAPAGGSIHSTVLDMARWMMFNLGGAARGSTLLRPDSLRELHTPQISMGVDPSARKVNASYAIGWTVDSYNGRPRLSHGGYVHALHSEVLLFPRDDVGVVAFTNFGPPMLALLIAEHVFDLLMGFRPMYALEERLQQYEQKIADTRKLHEIVRHRGAAPCTRALSDYAGTYLHPAYGAISITADGGALSFHRNRLNLALEHRQGDIWSFGYSELFEIHQPHPFDLSSELAFEASVEDMIDAVHIRLEPAVAAIRFAKVRGSR